MTLKHLFFLVLRFCLPLVILATPAYLHAQMDKIKLEPIYSENQLSQSVAMSITQDRRGYFWVGTQDGLNRYDGYRFRTFKHKAFFPETLSASYIRALCVDRDEFLWIGGRSSGLDRYDWRSGTFSHYRNDPTDPHSLSHDFVTSVIEDKNGDIWVGTDNGLNRLDKKTGRFTRFMSGPSHGQGGPSPGQGGPSPRQGKPSPGQGKPSLGQGKPSPGRKNNPNPGSLTHDSILCLFQDGDGTLWIGTDGGGVNAFNPRTSDFFRYTVETTGQGLCSNSVRAICSDSEHPGVLWLGTSGGLSRFDVRRQEFTNYYHKPDEPRSLSLNDIGAIAEDNEGRLWIGTGTGPQVGNGITILDKKSMNFFRYTHHGDEARKLNNSSILDIFKDPMGVMWVGTYGSGVYKYDPKKHKFTHYKHKPGTNSLNTSEVWHISEDRDTNLWIGTLNGGVNFLDKKSGRFTHYMNEPENPNSLAHNSARALMVDRAGFVWIGTAVGLDFLDPESGRFIHYAPDADNPDCLPANVISFLMEDGRGNIWVGTWGGGLHRLDKS
ncbi:MAG: hypothetical protein GY765_05725, partial [bacterium]|nr:hypothetical protein [bacterium]